MEICFLNEVFNLRLEKSGDSTTYTPSLNAI